MDLDSLDAQYRRQAAWFLPVRAQLLRRVNIAGKGRVLEIGCGTGVVTEELVRRCPGHVTALDAAEDVFAYRRERFGRAECAVASAGLLPFEPETFDLVFTQMLFLWVKDPAVVAREAARVLRPGCELVVAAEPDYGGAIEHPGAGVLHGAAAALKKQGADPEVARKLPAALAAAGFHIQMGVHASLFQPDELKEEWEREREFLARLQNAPAPASPAPEFLFMPYFWFLARKEAAK